MCVFGHSLLFTAVYKSVFEYWHVKSFKYWACPLHIVVNSFRSEVYHKPVWVVSHYLWHVAVVSHLRRGDTPAIPGCAFLWFPGGLSALQRLPATSWRVQVEIAGWLNNSHACTTTLLLYVVLNGQVPHSPHLKSLNLALKHLRWTNLLKCLQTVLTKNFKAHFHSYNFFLLEAPSALTLNCRDAINRSAVGSIYQRHYVLTSVRVQHIMLHEFCL